MHELSVVFHILKIVKEEALKNHVKHVSKVKLEVGEVSTVVPYYLLDCWKWACSKEEVLKDCKMEYEVVKAVTYCQDCGETYSTLEHKKVCPNCKSENTYLVVGNEVNIKEIEVDEMEEEQ